MLATSSRAEPVRFRRRLVPALLTVTVAGGVLAGGFPPASAQVVDIARSLEVPASEDAYVSSARATFRFGSDASLIAGAVGGDRMVSYLKFTVDAAANATVQRAELRIMLQAQQWPTEMKIKAVPSSAWSESALDWGNRPATGDTLATVRPEPTASEIRFDLTHAVTGAGTYTFAVTSPASDQIGRFFSTDSGANGPRLFLRTVTPEECAVGEKLVPNCGILWGAAAGGFSDTPRDEALKIFDAKAGRTSAIFHTYRSGDELFPTKMEAAAARDPETPRLLMINWKVARGTTWAAVARGEMDARIDRLSNHIKTTFPERFFIVPHHEPENDVIDTPGSGMEAKDYAAMYRHTVQRMRANGVDNAVFVVAYMNYFKWNNSPWWYDLYPGDDVVDWIGLDSYVNAEPGGFHNGDFSYLMDRTTAPDLFPGWYSWATAMHPGKPIMVAEWGVYDSSAVVDPLNKARIFDSVLPQLQNFPAIKALVYFETASDQAGRDIRMDSSPESLAAFQRIAADPRFDVKLSK